MSISKLFYGGGCDVCACVCREIVSSFTYLCIHMHNYSLRFLSHTCLKRYAITMFIWFLRKLYYFSVSVLINNYA